MPLDLPVQLSELSERTSSEFADRYGRAPSVVAVAPGRVNVIGEHTDYNDGFVLPMAIDRYSVVAAGHSDRGRVRLFSASTDSEASLSPSGVVNDEQPSWAKYAAGVLSVYSEEGFEAPAFDAVIDSTVPIGGGLSSSAALEVSLATAIEALGGYDVEPARKALLCQKAEHRAGMPCGIMDQFSSALCKEDHLMLLDCRDQSVTMRRFEDPGVTVLITNSNVKHELTGGEYAERRQQCEEAARSIGVASLRDANSGSLAAAKLEGVLLRRARHVVSEIERTVRAAESISRGDWEQAGRDMYDSHASLRDDFEVSCPELDVLVEAAREIGVDGGVYGSRMTGGGFGGCTVSLIRADRAEEVADRIAERYRDRCGVDATQFVTRPSRGAHVVN